MGNFYVLAYKCCDVMPSIFHVNVKTFGLAKFCSFIRVANGYLCLLSILVLMSYLLLKYN